MPLPLPPSCAVPGPGRDDCGLSKENCCASPVVPGGTYFRTYTNDGTGPLAEADPATVSTFRLDKYDVTVGRYRQFVAAWQSGWWPQAGWGKHAHLNGGQGLAMGYAPGTFEPGWVEPYDLKVAPTDTTSCSYGSAEDYLAGIWTSAPGPGENLPITCVGWWTAYAFCIWDGGFLPSEAEWEYAAAGGSEQREYPWGSADPGPGSAFAVGSPNSWPYDAVAPVGHAASGAGRWGQLDLAGNTWQWALDTYASYAVTCSDCTYVSTVAADLQVLRGGGQGGDNATPPFDWVPWFRESVGGPGGNWEGTGIRCARSP